MAELGLLANLAGVVGAGLQLSEILYNFARVLGRAAREISLLHCEVALFCTVLKSVQSVLNKASKSRFSLSALDTTQEVIDRCQEIFTQIRKIVQDLRNGRSQGVSLASRVKWTFKQAKVQALQESLKFCTMQLQLMITTLSLGERLSNLKSPGSDADQADQQTAKLTQHLLLIQRDFNDRLENLEKAAQREEYLKDTDVAQESLLPESANHPNSTATMSSRRRNQSPERPGCMLASHGAKAVKVERTSTLLDDSLYRDNKLSREVVPSGAGNSRSLRLSVSVTNTLLQEWIDQSKSLDFTDNRNIMLPNEPKLVRKRTAQASDLDFLAELPLDHESKAAETGGYLGPGITVDDPCYKVLQKALKNNGIEASWKDFALYIDYDNQERYIGPYEKILEVFRDLIRSGKDPEITIRSLKSCEDIPGDLYDGVVDS